MTSVAPGRRPWQRSAGVPDKRKRGRAGQRDRERRLARTNGLCEMCLAEGRIELATVVNHKVPLAHGGEDVDENTENLCDRHDQAATAEQFGRSAPIEAKGISSSGRPTSPDHPWNRGRRPG
jgi:5-methylcytosine-specific restriction enzyme A